MAMIGTTEELDVKQDIRTTYRWVAHADTPIVMVTRKGPLGGFASYELITGDWTQEGSSRRISLDDGSKMTETIKTIEQPSYFDYQLDDYATPMLRRLFKRAVGQFWFTAMRDGSTQVVWRYSFQPAGPLVTPAVWLFVNTIYRSYMRNAVGNMKRISAEENLAIKSVND